MQRDNAKLVAEHQQAMEELSVLRALHGGAPRGGPGQGVPEGGRAPSGPQSFSEELLKSGELDFIANAAENPELGVKGMVLALAQAFDKRMDARVAQLQSEAIDPVVRRMEGAPIVARGLAAAQKLAVQFPEIADDNDSPEAEEAQQEILRTIEALPRDWVRSNPDRAIKMAVMEYRDLHGVPTFAQPPGMSGSPSSLAASAAEAAAARTTAAPLDGSGVPRQRPSGQPETFADRVRRENREVAQVAKTPSGRPLGFEAAG
jgi:hypothetical protein